MDAKLLRIEVYIGNATDSALEDVSVLLRPDQPVTAVAAANTVSGVTVALAFDLFVRPELLDATTGHRAAIPFSLLTTNIGYRVRCPRLPPKATLAVVMALARVIDIQRRANDPRSVLTVNFADGTSAQFGYPDRVEYAARSAAKSVHVEGEYTLSQDRSSVNTDVKVQDLANSH
jgi:hypothetical protein